jgi:DNA-binding NarL/FixJ family response regulator
MPYASDRLRVMVVDDSTFLLNALVRLFEDQEGLELVGAASGPLEALALAQRVQPDVALLDVRLRDGGGPAVASGLPMVAPATRMIAYTSEVDGAALVDMARAGVVAYVAKAARVPELLTIIRAVGELAPFLPPPSRPTSDLDARVRLLIAHGEVAVLHALVDLFGEDDSVQVVDAVSDAGAALRSTSRHGPDAALIDAGMPAGPGETLAGELARHFPALRIVAPTLVSDRTFIYRLLEDGVTSSLFRVPPSQELRDDLLRAIRDGAERVPASIVVRTCGASALSRAVAPGWPSRHLSGEPVR